MRSLQYLSSAVLLVAISGSHYAYADIFECEEPGGSKRFTNIKSEAKGCKQLTVTPAIVTSPPPIPGGAPTRNSDARPAPSGSGAEGFPKVSPAAQQSRDNDRKKILETELSNEERNLANAKRELAEADAIRNGGESRNQALLAERLDPFQKKVKFHEDNIANLRKELSNVR